MEDLEGEYIGWIEMPVAGCLGRMLCLRTEQDQCMALVIGQNNPGVLHLQFYVQMPKNCVHALLGIVSHRFPKSHSTSKRRNGMHRVFLAVPKAVGRCKRYQMPDQLHSGDRVMRVTSWPLCCWRMSRRCYTAQRTYQKDPTTVEKAWLEGRAMTAFTASEGRPTYMCAN